MELLRFSTAGSVDDGKSTLIGRLLYDSKSIFQDGLMHLKHIQTKKDMVWLIWLCLPMDFEPSANKE